MCETVIPQTYYLGELFSGAGGLALGAHKARYLGHRYESVWAIDSDRDACETLRLNFPMLADKILCDKVENIRLDKLDPIDGLLFGFPCNDFSLVGGRQGIAGEYGGLYRWGVKTLEILQPIFFVAENVGGLASSGNSKDLDTILDALEDAGYDIYPHTYSFDQYGVPQTRKRIIIVGYRKDIGVKNFTHPLPTTEHNPITAETALAEIPAASANHESPRHTQRVKERLSHIRPGENAFTADLPSHLRLDMKSGAKISQIYKRLRPDKPAYTVTGSGGGGTHLYHWKENRALTNRERARLQSFPDDFVFLGGKESVRKQIGMAVPPAGSEIIFSAVLRTLAENRIVSQARSDYECALKA